MSVYRQQLRACPACATPMDAVPVSGDPSDPQARAEADVCAKCGGMFLEFFDGEPAAISRDILRNTDVKPTVSLNVGTLRCPDCAEEMVRKAYLDQGPELARCETCMAVFLAPDEVETLARMELKEEPAPKEPSWLSRLIGWLPGVSQR
jgi:Zn-finger nucleic acid-binding protein